jgi:hypothetical protein
MGAVVQGIPECVFATTEDDNASRTNVQIMVELAQSCGVDEASMARRGAAVMALVDLLESTRRFNVSVYAVISIAAMGNKKVVYQAVIRLKAIGHDYDPNAVAYALAHPSFFRKICFAHFDVQPDNRALGFHAEQCYGRGDIKASIPAICKAINEKDDCIDMMVKMYNSPRQFASDEGCEEYVLEQLKFYNVLTD